MKRRRNSRYMPNSLALPSESCMREQFAKNIFVIASEAEDVCTPCCNTCEK